MKGYNQNNNNNGKTMYWTKERVKAEHEPNMIGKKKISREFQVTEADGNLMWFDTTSKGLKEALECFLKAETEYNNMPEDDRDCIPCIELYERFMIHDGWDWEVDNFNHLELHQKMPTKAIQKIVDRLKK